MSGHSKWSKIKHKKGAKDAKRGKEFTKLGKAITIAANEGGGDPSMNFTLRLAIDKAKAANMPSENIDRAIKKGTGELEGGQLTRISYEGYGASSVPMIIDVTTDNMNRTVADLRKLLEGSGGKMADSGSVSWQFSEKGLIVVQAKKLKKSEKFGVEDTYESVDKDELMMELMEVEGIEDIKEETIEDPEEGTVTILEIFTEKTQYANVDKKINEMQIKVESSDLAKIANDPVELTDEKREKLENHIELIEENEDVDNVWVAIN